MRSRMVDMRLNRDGLAFGASKGRETDLYNALRKAYQPSIFRPWIEGAA